MKHEISEKHDITQGWLRHTPKSFPERLFAKSIRIEIESGGLISSVGDEVAELWGIAKGQAHINTASRERGPRFAHIFGPGSWGGEYPLLTGFPRAVEVIASCDCVIYYVPQQKFHSLAAEYPLSWKWVGLLASLNGVLALSSADDLLIRNSDVRLAALLLRLSGRRGVSNHIIPLDDIDVTQQNISEALNLSRTATGHKLRNLKDENIIDYSYNKIQIKNPQALFALLDD